MANSFAGRNGDLFGGMWILDGNILISIRIILGDAREIGEEGAS